jgi:hypothetical protein
MTLIEHYLTNVTVTSTLEYYVIGLKCLVNLKRYSRYKRYVLYVELVHCIASGFGLEER